MIFFCVIGLGAEDVFRLEASLLSLRDYAVLNMLALKSLLESAKDTFRRTHVQVYEEELKRKSNFFVQYARKAVKGISKHFKRFRRPFTKREVDCDKHESFVKRTSPTQNETLTSECRYALVPHVVPPQKCHLSTTMVRGGVRDPSYRKRTGYPEEVDEAMKRFATDMFREKQRGLKEEAWREVMQFWEVELLETLRMAHKLTHGKYF